MKPVTFEGVNVNFTAPKGKEDEVGNLPTLKTPTHIISCWEPNEEELKQIMETKKVWIGVMGGVQPPIFLTGIMPMEVQVAQTELQAAKKNYGCFGCSQVNKCKYAWDPYNKDGDCLANK